MGTSINFNEKKGFICDMDGVIYHGCMRRTRNISFSRTTAATRRAS